MRPGATNSPDASTSIGAAALDRSPIAAMKAPLMPTVVSLQSQSTVIGLSLD